MATSPQRSKKTVTHCPRRLTKESWSTWLKQRKWKLRVQKYKRIERRLNKPFPKKLWSTAKPTNQRSLIRRWKPYWCRPKAKPHCYKNTATQDYWSNLIAFRQHAHKWYSVYPDNSKISNFEFPAFDKNTFLIARLIFFARAMTVVSMALLGSVNFEGWGIGDKTALIQGGYADDAAGRMI